MRAAFCLFGFDAAPSPDAGIGQLRADLVKWHGGRRVGGVETAGHGGSRRQADQAAVVARRRQENLARLEKQRGTDPLIPTSEQDATAVSRHRRGWHRAASLPHATRQRSSTLLSVVPHAAPPRCFRVSCTRARWARVRGEAWAGDGRRGAEEEEEEARRREAAMIQQVLPPPQAAARRARCAHVSFPNDRPP